MEAGSRNCEICPPTDVSHCEVAGEGHHPMMAQAEINADRISRDEATDDDIPNDGLRHGTMIDRQNSTKSAFSRSNSLLRRVVEEEGGGSDEGQDSDDDDAESFTLEMFNSLTADVEDSGRQKKAEQTSTISANVEAPAQKEEQTRPSGGMAAALKNRMSLAQAANKVKNAAKLVAAFKTPAVQQATNVVINMEDESKHAKLVRIVQKKPDLRSPAEVDNLVQWLKTTDRMYAMERPMLRNFARALELVEYQIGDRIFGVGDGPDFFYVIFEGICDEIHENKQTHEDKLLGGLQKSRVTMGGKLFSRKHFDRSESGKQKEATTLVPKCGFGDKAIMGNFIHSCTITCTSHVLMLQADAKTFKDIMIGKAIKHETTFRIHELPELRNVEDSVIETFAHAFEEVRFRAGDILCHQGEGRGPHAHVFWITSGTVTCYADPLHDPTKPDAGTPTEDPSRLVTLATVTSGGLVGDSALKAGYYTRLSTAASAVTAFRVEVCDVRHRLPSDVVNNILRAADSKLQYQKQRSTHHVAAALSGLAPAALPPTTDEMQLSKGYHLAISKKRQISRGFILREFNNSEADTVQVPKVVKTSIIRKTTTNRPQTCQLSTSCFLQLRLHSPADVLRSQQGATPLSALSPLSPLSPGPYLPPPLFPEGSRLAQRRSRSMTAEELVRKGTQPKSRAASLVPRASLPDISLHRSTKNPSSSLRGAKCKGTKSRVIFNQKVAANEEQGTPGAATRMSAPADSAHSAMLPDRQKPPTLTVSTPHISDTIRPLPIPKAAMRRFKADIKNDSRSSQRLATIMPGQQLRGQRHKNRCSLP